MLVMVQREVGERLAAAAGDDAYGAVSVKVAYWATATVVGRVSASVFIPRPRVESVLVRLDRRPERMGGAVDGVGTEHYQRLFSVVRAGFAHRRKMLRRSLESQVRPEAFDAVGIRSTARAEELSLEEWERLAAWRPSTTTEAVRGARTVTEGRPGPTEVRAPAKLTLSLEVTGTRGDGYHLLESEMVTVDLADTLVIEDGRGLTLSSETPRGGAGWWDGSLSVGDDNLVARALAATGRTAKVHVVKRIPPGAGLGGGSTDAAAVLRWAGCTDSKVAVRLGADVPFCLAGGRAMVRGRGRGDRGAALRGTAVHPSPGSLRRRHRGRLPGVGRAGGAGRDVRAR